MQTNVVGVKLIDVVDMEDFKVGLEDMVFVARVNL